MYKYMKHPDKFFKFSNKSYEIFSLSFRTRSLAERSLLVISGWARVFRYVWILSLDRGHLEVMTVSMSRIHLMPCCSMISMPAVQLPAMRFFKNRNTTCIWWCCLEVWMKLVHVLKWTVLRDQSPLGRWNVLTDDDDDDDDDDENEIPTLNIYIYTIN